MVDWSLGEPEFCKNCNSPKVLVKINDKFQTKCKYCSNFYIFGLVNLNKWNFF